MSVPVDVMSEPKLIPLTMHVDDRGSLYEVFHHFDLETGGPFRGQVYVVRSPARGTIRGFHRHQRLSDFFCVVHGRAKIVVVRTKDGQEPAVEDHRTYVLAEEKPALLVVPQMWWHGWEALTDDVILLSVASELYDREHPDEERIPFDAFGTVWGIQPR